MDDFKNCMNEFSFMQFFLGRRDSHEKTNFYRLSQNKLVILQKTKESGMEQEDFDIRNQQPVTSRERVADELERIAGDENLKHLLQQK